ncbi:hypothetical protein HMPREF1493_1231 [Atopobium sp. ICM42b]|nr:hypothetical protein HMPREF1493_1231 [Atopobium sp. ICM42b]
MQKNRWLKYRFFALFRRVQQKAGVPGEKPVRSQPRSYPRPARNPRACSHARTRAWRETRVLGVHGPRMGRHAK